MEKSNKTYFKFLDIIRILSCLAIFLYHLGYLDGGYLAVCIFFVLTGFLSCISSFKKEKFSIIKYYKDRLLKIYLPLLIVVFLSVLLVTTLIDFNWINLKPETTSVILGYNNYWQLNANLDYFTKLVTSPFIHFWYMGILLQFELVFPIVFLILKKIGDKIYKIIPCLILAIISIISCIYFYISTQNSSIMVVYYDTFTRLFSIVFGVTIGFVYHYYKNFIPKIINKKFVKILINLVYLIILIAMSIMVPSTSDYFALAMIITSLITCRIIKYSLLLESSNESNLLKTISRITYEIYLVQYPVIFIFQNINITNSILKTILIIITTFIVSFVINYAINFKYKKDEKVKYNKIRITILCLLVIAASFGAYKYMISKDYTNDAKELENKLKQNEELMKEKQKEYVLNQQKENEEWEKVLNDLESGEENIKNIVSNLSVIGIGDSVILDAIPYLYKYFPNGYFDAKQSRTDYEADDIIIALKNKGMLGNPIVIGLGTNGQCGPRCHKVIVSLCEDRKIFWINVTNDREVHVNKSIENLANEYENVYLIDWNTISQGHSDYFIYDGIHLRPKGQQAYADAIYQSIYNVYLDEYNEKKNEIINKHNEELKEKTNFYGDELLLNVLEYIEKDFKNSKFEVDKDLTYAKLYQKLISDKESNLLSNNLVFVLNDIFKDKELEEIIKLCEDRKVTIIINSEKNINITNENVKVININNSLKESDYFMYDKVHLKEEGNRYLSLVIKEEVNKNAK